MSAPTLGVLVDSSVWIEHLRGPDERLSTLLEADRVITHPFVIGELACGNFRNRRQVIERLGQLPGSPEPRLTEVREMIEARALHGRGIGLIDCTLLASAILGPHVSLWTRDRRLRAAAADAGVAWGADSLH